MKRIILIIGVAALLATGLYAASALASATDKPPAPPGQGPCNHGNSDKPCKEDPSPNGQDCEEHGPKEGGVNEDHCLGTTETTTTTDTTTTEETTTGETTTTPGETTATEGETTTSTPVEPPVTTPDTAKPPVVVTKTEDANGDVIIVKKNKKTGSVEVKRPGGKFVPAIQGQG